MRIDSKYFNRFIAGTALLTAVIIVYSTFRYSQKQAADFEKTISQVDFSDVRFQVINGDSLSVPDIINNTPAVISFWATWSEKSHDVHLFLEEYQQNNPDILIVAAAVRDDETLIKNYIDQHPFPFEYVYGTDFFQKVLIPGLPAQLFFLENGELYSTHIGNNIREIAEILNRMNNQ